MLSIFDISPIPRDPAPGSYQILHKPTGKLLAVLEVELSISRNGPSREPFISLSLPNGQLLFRGKSNTSGLSRKILSFYRTAKPENWTSRTGAKK